MARIDLDAKRAARDEATNTPHEVTLGGDTFILPARIPLEVIDLMAEGAFREAFGVLLDDPGQVERFFAHRPDDGDLEDIMGLYGQLGESSASPTSSPSSGRRSRPTSTATTGSGSRKLATANSSSAAANS